MGRFSTIATEGIKSVWQNDYRSQQKYLEIIAEARQTDAELLRKVDAFFVPNNEYLSSYFGEEIREAAYNCYDYDGLCKWSNNLIIPIYNLADEIVAFGGFNPLLYTKAHEDGAQGENYYQYSSKSVFRKGSYLYSPRGMQKKAILEQYAFVTDGIFDTISLAGAGFNAVSLMSSSVTVEIAVQLKMIGNILIVNDNDKAGLALQKKIKAVVPGAKAFVQGMTKDIDELLNSGYRDVAIAQLTEARDRAVAVWGRK